jgi:hypothetical protein
MKTTRDAIRKLQSEDRGSAMSTNEKRWMDAISKREAWRRRP